jgi:hypothetical protein
VLEPYDSAGFPVKVNTKSVFKVCCCGHKVIGINK